MSEDGWQEVKTSNSPTKTAGILAMVWLAAAVALSGRPTGAHTGKVLIGFSIEAMNGERWQTDLDAFQSRAKELGAEVISADAHGLL